MKRWRENYTVSTFLAAVTKPVWRISRTVSTQIQSKVVKNGVTVRLTNGKEMVIGRDAGVALASLLFWKGLDGYEPETSRALRFFFVYSSCFIDVGANCGLYSIIGALWNPTIRVVAFEPLPPIFQCLRTNVALNKVQDRVVCENLALAGQSGTGVFHVPPSEGRDFATTGTLASDSWQVRQRANRVQVTTVRFDEYENQHPMRVDLIKIDVEDFEADVLEGMRATIMRDRPFIVCEILPRNQEHRNERTRRLIEALDYTAYWITDAGYFRVSRFDFERTDFKDFVLSPVSTEQEVLTDLSVLLEAKLRKLGQSRGTTEGSPVFP